MGSFVVALIDVALSGASTYTFFTTTTDPTRSVRRRRPPADNPTRVSNCAPHGRVAIWIRASNCLAHLFLSSKSITFASPIMKISILSAIGALAGLAATQETALTLDSPDAIRKTAAAKAWDLLQYYHGNETGQVPGILPGPPPSGLGDYYWWEGGAMWGTLIDYWFLTGDDTYNDLIKEGVLFQVPFSNVGYNYKNSIANGCFFNIASRLARYTDNSTYAEWAEKTWDWMQSVGFMGENNDALYDGAHVESNCTDINKEEYSY